MICFVFCIVNGVFLNVQDTQKLEKALKHFILMLAVLLLAMWVSTSVAGASMRLTGTILAFCGSGIVCLFIWIYLEIGQRAISVVRGSKVVQSLLSLATN